MGLFRSAGNGQIFAQASSPTGTTSGSFWYDTTNNLLKLNINGTLTTIIPSGLTTGDMLYFDGTNMVRLAVGTSTQGIFGGTNPGYATIKTLTKQIVYLTSNFTTTSNTLVDVTGMTVTIPSRTSGIAFVDFIIYWKNSGAAGTNNTFAILDNGTNVTAVDWDTINANNLSFSESISTTLAGQVVKLQTLTTAGTTTVTGGASVGNNRGQINTYEVS